MEDNASMDFSVGEFRPEDGAGIVALFQSVYGDGYPVRTFYEPEAIVAANREDRIYSIVARGPDGKIIGATHLFRHATAKSLYEWGGGLTSHHQHARPEYIIDTCFSVKHIPWRRSQMSPPASPVMLSRPASDPGFRQE